MCPHSDPIKSDQPAINPGQTPASFGAAFPASTLDCVIAIDSQGKIVEWNPVAALVFGYSRLEAVGREMVELIIPPEQRPQHRQELARYLATGQSPALGKQAELTAMRRDGSAFAVEVVITRQAVEIEPTFIVQLRDITLRKQSEQDLRDSEAKHRAILETAVDGIITIDERGMIESINPATERLFGYTAQELLGQNVKVLMPEPYHSEHDGYLEHYRRTGERRIIGIGREVQGKRKDGSVFPLDLAVSEVKLGNRRIFTGIIRDATARKQAEQALRESEAQYRAIFQGAVDGIVTIDERGIIESINPAAERLFGYAAAEVMGQNVKILMPEPYHSHHDQYLSSYMHTGQAKIIGIGREVQGKRKDGSTFPMDLAVSEVKLGNRRMFTGLVRDITLRKQAEKEVMQAKDEAIAANAAKDQFIAVVSHELRTPLNPILVAVAYLESRMDLPQDVREELVAIRRNIEHETRLVDDLLNLTRLARGKIELHQEAVDAHALLRAVLAQFQAKIEQKHIRIVTSLRARQHYIWADPTRIRQVMTNLVDNAIKFSPDQREINLRTAYTADGGFRLEIADSGIGIEPDMLERLFNPFEQGERTIARKFGGMGLGLAICKGIVDLHGGKLTAHSDGKDKGATFVLELAVVPAAAGEMVGEDGPEELADQGCRVLLVEDHPDTLRIMAKLLKAMGYNVISATNVSEALRLAHDEPFDILLSDIGLPDGTGLDLLRQIKAERSIKAIAVSGFTQEEDRQRGHQAGFLEYLTKPVDFQMLESVLRRVGAQDPISPPPIWKN